MRDWLVLALFHFHFGLVTFTENFLSIDLDILMREGFLSSIKLLKYNVSEVERFLGTAVFNNVSAFDCSEHSESVYEIGISCFL